ncbi:hypothetical protein COLO4_20473 [Corchorus olitorius]|uniref:Uncharacterized protein n=1 Tax=Corchorus olitorius TaxID=93759 RepID=A0A1R3IZS5_9ROSI|nr:hypothetical protein COLO4_20473 [Corchorus olitorius]
MKTPVKAEEVVKDYPGHVLLESESVKHYGIRAKPLLGHQNLEPKRLYFLVELPEAPKEIRVPRRVRSGINMSAKDRLESLMLSRRSVSDLTLMKPKSCVIPEETAEEVERSENGATRVKLRLPKAEVERLMKESANEAEAAEKIMQLCIANANATTSNNNSPRGGVDEMHWKSSHGRVGEGFKAREKRVSFLPISEGGSQIAVTS